MQLSILLMLPFCFMGLLDWPPLILNYHQITETSSISLPLGCWTVLEYGMTSIVQSHDVVRGGLIARFPELVKYLRSNLLE